MFSQVDPFTKHHCLCIFLLLWPLGRTLAVPSDDYLNNRDSLRQIIDSGDARDKLLAYPSLFNLYYDHNNDTAFFVALDFVDEAENNGQPLDQVISLESLALAYDFFRSDYSNAFACYEKALKICEQFDLDYQVYILHGFGILFHLSDDYEKAYEYYEQAYELTKSNDDQTFLKKVMVNMASTQSSLGNFPEAERLFLQAVEIRQTEDLYLETSTLSNLANLYIRKNEPLDAIPHLLNAIKINRELGLENEILYDYSYLIDAKLAAGDLSGFDTLLHIVEENITDRTQLRNRMIIRYSIYKAYQALEQYKLASENQDLYIQLYDSLKNQQRSDLIYELEAKYNNARNEKEIAELEIEKQKSQNERNLFIFAVIIVFIVSLLLFVLLRAKSKTNKVITETLKERETLLKEIHHRVKNNLQIISSLLNLQAGHLNDDAAKEAVKEGQNRVKSMALIHQKLYQNDDITGIELRDYIENLAQALYQSFGADPGLIELDLDIEQLRLDIDTLIPMGLVLNELVSNSLKYAFPEGNGKLKIGCHKSDDNLELVVKDDGPGFKEEDIATRNSYGWKMIRSLSRKLKADIDISSKEGTEISLQIKNFKLVA